MEMLKKFKKRIVPLVLAVVIFATSVVSGPMSLTARAASVTVDAEFSTELAMLLYNIMETVAISSGIKDGLDDRRDDIFAACEQLMPEGDVIYGDVKEIQEENRSACAGGGNICN